MDSQIFYNWLESDTGFIVDKYSFDENIFEYCGITKYDCFSFPWVELEKVLLHPLLDFSKAIWDVIYKGSVLRRTGETLVDLVIVCITVNKEGE